jgi:hypothetical protein
MVSWGEFASAQPDLAAFGERLLQPGPAYLATLRANGVPRVHPVTPILSGEHLFLFMEPTSPKRRDLLDRGAYSLHNGVPDNSGTGGEFSVGGTARPVDDLEMRAEAERAASYPPADRYVLFELDVTEARCNGYGDVPVPETRRWTA